MMQSNCLAIFAFAILLFFTTEVEKSSALDNEINVDLSKSFVFGPGLDKHVTLPVRYFFIQPVDTYQIK